MLVQVKHRGWDLYKVFITKIRGGGGRYIQGRVGRFVKIRLRRNNKVQNTHTTTASKADTYTQRSGSYNTCSNIQGYIQSTIDLELLYLYL